jgi:hypothetical protein
VCVCVWIRENDIILFCKYTGCGCEQKADREQRDCTLL